MTHRGKIIAVLNGEKPDVIPSYLETPMDVTVLRGLMPEPTGDEIKDQAARAQFFGNSAVYGAGIGVPAETISKYEDHHRYRCETGAVWSEEYNPTFFREAESFPINSPEEALEYKMIDANEP